MRKLGVSVPSLSSRFSISKSVIKDLVWLIDAHGLEILRNNQNRYYSSDYKLEIINRVLIEHKSISSVAVEIGLSSTGMLSNWIHDYMNNGYNVIEKKRGRRSMMKSKSELKKALTSEEENEYLKKLNAVVKQRVKREKKKK